MKIERGIPPPPPPDANAQVHRLDAEAEAWMQAHAPGILNAWLNTGDPSDTNHWDEAAVRKHWPELWTRWRALGQAKDRLRVLMDNEYERRRPRRPL
jgi:hypothetical protein